MLLHVPTETFFVEAARDMPSHVSFTETQLQTGRHPCDPLQEAFDTRAEVQFLMLNEPDYDSACRQAEQIKRELDRKYKLINDGTNNPMALIGYH